MRSQTPITSAMLWWINSTPVSCSSRRERTTAANSGTSASGSPAAGSSISTNDGSVASTRATPRPRSPPCEGAAAPGAAPAPVRERGGAGVCEGREPEEQEQVVGPPARRARAGADAERRHLDVLAHREATERAAVLERSREARD